jgi:hypothetical protein
MAQSDAFALKNSGLNDFLFAEVGTELNGSRLTILSVLARLGQDPWVEAAKWAKLPRATMIDRLASSISQMPLSQQAPGEVRATAARLVALLPSQRQTPENGQGTSASKQQDAVPKWLIAAVLGGLLLGIAFGMARLNAPANPITPLGHTALDVPSPSTN